MVDHVLMSKWKACWFILQDSHDLPSEILSWHCCGTGPPATNIITGVDETTARSASPVYYSRPSSWYLEDTPRGARQQAFSSTAADLKQRGAHCRGYRQRRPRAATMPWPFCPSCGTVLDPPESGDILCAHCGLRTSYESFGEVEVVTRSQDRALPEWVVQLQRKGTKQELQRATVEEACPKCGHPKMEFYTMQLRSADEGQTVFYECLSKSCKHKYAVNN